MKLFILLFILLNSIIAFATAQSVIVNSDSVTFKVIAYKEKDENRIEVTKGNKKKTYPFFGYCDEFFLKNTQETKDFVLLKYGCSKPSTEKLNKMMDDATYFIYDKKTERFLKEPGVKFSYRSKNEPIDSHSTSVVKVKKIGNWLYQIDKSEDGKDSKRCVIDYKNGGVVIVEDLSTDWACSYGGLREIK